MIIIVGENGMVDLPQGNVLGCVDENKFRKHKVIHPKFDDAYYTLLLDYGENSMRTVQIVDGVITIEDTMVQAEGEVRAQFRAAKVEDEEMYMFKSEIFTVRILPSI